MAFVCERIREEDFGLFDSLGWKDIFMQPVRHYVFRWCKDIERNAYLLILGKFRDETPFFCDFWYKHRIVRIDAERSIVSVENGVRDVIWDINCIYLPKSLCEEQQDIIPLITEAFCADDEHLISRGYYGKTITNMTNHIEIVEKDYNGN